MDILVTDIAWDTDGEDVDLPSELTVDTAAERIGDPDTELADWLADKYGWCVIGFSHAPATDMHLDSLTPR